MHLYFTMSMKSGCRRSLKFAKNIYQNSVFRGEITPSKLIGLKTDLKKVIQEDEDFICIIKLFNENVFGEEVLGKKDRENGEQLIL